MYHPSSPESIQALFASIAHNYDKANTLFTFGLHKRWNHKLIDSLEGAATLLDLCAGTGEIAFGFLKKNPASEAILLDFCPEMLTIAQKKGQAFKGRFEMIQGDAPAQ
jgi:demethylmenaquinone methyltransferase/2-methoxy-6-polyprenyl-1,4-benzoquinol methylase